MTDPRIYALAKAIYNLSYCIPTPDTMLTITKVRQDMQEIMFDEINEKDEGVLKKHLAEGGCSKLKRGTNG